MPRIIKIERVRMKNIFWNSLGTAAWSFLSLFLLIIVTRINGIIDSGLFSFAFAFAVIMFTIVSYGGRAYQVSDHKNSFAADNYISLRIFTSLTVLVITLLFVLINGYDWQKSVLIFLLVGQRIFDGIADVFYGIMQKKHHLYISGKSLFYKSLISVLVFFIIDLLERNLLLSCVSLPFISLLFILFYDIPQSQKLESFSIKVRFAEINKILKSAFLTFAVAIMGLIFANLARFFIDMYHPNLQGYFGIIITPLSLIILLFSFILTPAILSLSDKYNNQEFHALNKSIRDVIYITSVTTLIICIFMYFFGAPLLKLLFNVDYTKYVIDIVLVVLIGCLLSVTSLFSTIAIIARRLKITAIVYLLSNILLALLCMILVERLQIHGAIIAYIIASAVQTIIMGLYYINLTSRQRLSKNS